MSPTSYTTMLSDDQLVHHYYHPVFDDNNTIDVENPGLFDVSNESSFDQHNGGFDINNQSFAEDTTTLKYSTDSPTLVNHLHHQNSRTRYNKYLLNRQKQQEKQQQSQCKSRWEFAQNVPRTTTAVGSSQQLDEKPSWRMGFSKPNSADDGSSGSSGGVDVLRRMRADIERRWRKMLERSTGRSKQRERDREMEWMMKFGKGHEENDYCQSRIMGGESEKNRLARTSIIGINVMREMRKGGRFYRRYSRRWGERADEKDDLKGWRRWNRNCGSQFRDETEVEPMTFESRHCSKTLLRRKDDDIARGFPMEEETSMSGVDRSMRTKYSHALRRTYSPTPTSNSTKRTLLRRESGGW